MQVFNGRVPAVFNHANHLRFINRRWLRTSFETTEPMRRDMAWYSLRLLAEHYRYRDTFRGLASDVRAIRASLEQTLFPCDSELFEAFGVRPGETTINLRRLQSILTKMRRSDPVDLYQTRVDSSGFPIP